MRAPSRIDLVLKYVRDIRRDPKKQLTVIIYLGAVLAVVMLMSGVAIYAASTPAFCGVCHIMEPYINAWEQSSHANITCYACHGHPGVVNWMIGKVSSMKEIYLVATDSYHKPINGESRYSLEMETEVCEYCHKMSNRKVTPSKGVLIDHEKHEEKGIKCTRCHNRVAHRGATGFEGEDKARAAQVTFLGKVVKSEIYPDRMKMVFCMECHTKGKVARNGEAAQEAAVEVSSAEEAGSSHEEGAELVPAPKACSTCHPKDFNLKPSNHSTAGFVKPAVVGQRALHPKGFEKDEEYCRSCHSKEFCTNCHGVEMPHPTANWIKGKKEHTAAGRKNPQSCTTCHPGVNFCQQCHHPAYQPAKGTWIVSHQSDVNKNGANACFDCHGPTYCSHCHVRKQKWPTIKGP